MVVLHENCFLLSATWHARNNQRSFRMELALKKSRAHCLKEAVTKNDT